jgi:hypothetical protein
VVVAKVCWQRPRAAADLQGCNVNPYAYLVGMVQRAFRRKGSSDSYP